MTALLRHKREVLCRFNHSRQYSNLVPAVSCQ